MDLDYEKIWLGLVLWCLTPLSIILFSVMSWLSILLAEETGENN